PNNRIGGQHDEDRNVISGNRIDGVGIVDNNATGNVVEGNFVGTDLTGMAPLPNGRYGINLGQAVQTQGDSFASDNTVGGTAPGSRNVISGNGSIDADAKPAGVFILGGHGNKVQGNFIGLGADGRTRVPNLGDGVRIQDGSNNVIGGT